jgi:hypothetical protein
MLSAVAAIVLAVITWGYARTTRAMAEDSATAAHAALESAKASQLAAELAAANTPVQFSVRPHSILEGEEEFVSSIDVRCEAASVYLRSATLESYGVRNTSGLSTGYDRHTSRDWLPALLTPVDPTRVGLPDGVGAPANVPELPTRVLSGDSVHFLPASGPRIKGPISSLELRVEFSLTQDGDVVSRSVTGTLGLEWR